MQVELKRAGNSLCILLPGTTTDKYHLAEGDILIIEEHEDGLFINLKDPDFAAWLKAYHRANADYEEVLRELAR